MRRADAFLALIPVFCLITQGCDQDPKGIASADSPEDRPFDARDQSTPNDTQDAQSESFSLVMLGDSITAGYGLPASEALPVRLEDALRADGVPVRVINAGVSGDTSADALERFDWSISGKVDGVLIALGGNDLLQGINPETTRANLASIIERAQARGLTVMLAGMRAPGNYGKAFQEAFDAIFPSLAEDYDVALYPFLLDGVGAKAALNQPDGIHPNREGVTVIVEGLSGFIANEVR